MPADTRDRLITATRELLWQRGYSATSPKDIQALGQVGQGSMYHHFDGKEALGAAALQASAHDVLTAAEDQFGGEGSALERIAAYLRRQRPVLRGCPIGSMTDDEAVMASPILSAPVRETLGGLRDGVHALLLQAQAGGELGAFDASRVAATIVATVQGGYVLAQAAGDERPFSDAVEGALQLLEATR